MKIGYVYDPVYLKHDTEKHVENPERLKAIISRLEQTHLIEQLTPIKPRAASVDEIALVHNKNYISHIQDTANNGGGWLDIDTVMSPGSYEAAIYAVGGTIRATEAVMDGEANSAFALVRPPGHHATVARAMGFCLFNNIAIATKYALAKYKLNRVGIIDFDVHHGNGTQEAFYNNPKVLYISTHQFPLFPGTGRIEEIGTGLGRGNIINIPMPSGCGDNEYLQVFEQIIAPATRRFRPQLVLVSAGYDGHWADGLALMQVSVAGFAEMVKIIKQLADELCQGHTVLGLEGGYNLNALATSVKATFDVLLGNNVDDPVGKPQRRAETPNIDSLISSIRDIHNLS